MAAPIKSLEEQCGSFYASPAPSERVKLRRAAEPLLGTLATTRLDMASLNAFVKMLPSLVALCGTPSYDAVLLRVHGVVWKLLSGFPLSDLPDAVTATADVCMSSLFSLLRLPDKWVTGAATSTSKEEAFSHFGESPHVVMVAAAVVHDYMDWLVPLQSSLVVETNWHTWMPAAVADGDTENQAGEGGAAAFLGHMTQWLELAAARQMYQGKGGKKFKDDELNTNAELRVRLIQLARSLVQHPCSPSIPAGAWFSLVVCVAGRVGEPHFYRRDGLVCVEALRLLALLGESGPLSLHTWVGILNRVVLRAFPTNEEEAKRMVTATMDERRNSWEAFGTHFASRGHGGTLMPHVTSAHRLDSNDGSGGGGDGERDGEAAADDEAQDVEPLRTKDGLPLYFSEGLRASFDLVLMGLMVPQDMVDAAAVGNLVGPLNALLSVSVLVPGTVAAGVGTAETPLPFADLFYCVARVFAPKSKVADLVLARLYRSLCASTRFLANTVALLMDKLRTACWSVCEPDSLRMAVQCVTSLCEVLTWVLVAVLEEHRNSSRTGSVACAPAHKVNVRVSKALAEAEEVVASFFYRVPKSAVLVDFYMQFIEAHLLNLLLAFVTDAVLTVGVADEGAWLHSTRQQLHQVAAAVDRCVDKSVYRSSDGVARDVEKKLDGVNAAVAPFVQRIRSLLPNTDAKRLASSGATRLFDVMCDTIVLF